MDGGPISLQKCKIQIENQYSIGFKLLFSRTTDVILRCSPFTRIINSLWNKRIKLFLVQIVIFVGHYVFVLYSSYLELCNSDWGDLWSVGKGTNSSTFHMLDSEAKSAYIMV